MKPILFNTEMVRAILDGRKTVTRQVVKPQPIMYGFLETHWSWEGIKPPYRLGDILYVRETWGYNRDMWLYKADYSKDEWDLFRWHPSIHMPREAARLFLRVTDVRVERLQDITIEDAIKEGCSGVPCDCSNAFVAGGTLCCVDCMNTGWQEPPTVEFRGLWGSTIKKADLPRYGWASNPWVWVIEFERVSKAEAQKGGEADA